MKIQEHNLEQLFDSVCDPARESVTQSREAVVQNSWRKLSLDAKNLDATRVLAAANLVRRDPAKSIQMLSGVPAALDQDATSNRLAGYASLLLEKQNDARRYLDRAVRLDPHLPDCWNLLGKLAEQDDDEQSAKKYYERGMVFDRNEHESALALSNLQLRKKKLRDAIHTLRVCLFRDQRSPSLNVALAKLLQRRARLLGRRGKRRAQQRFRMEALGCLRTANAAAPTTATLVNQGRIEQQLLEYADAKRTFEKAVERDPDNAMALGLLASANVDCGEIDVAIRQFEKVIRLDPANANAHFQYTRAKKFKRGPESTQYLTIIQNQLQDAGLSGQAKIKLSFALAKVLDDTKCHDQAWDAFERGNRLKRGHSRCISKGVKTKRSAFCDVDQKIRQQVDFFTPEFFDRFGHVGNESRQPVFIVGMPRSGTTMTEQILSSHPDVAGAGELDYLSQIRHEIVAAYCGRTGRAPVDDHLYPGLLSEFPTDQLRQYADDYLVRLNRFGNESPRITDKMPTNFLNLGLIGLLFPGATVIHCRRNPMDVFVSCFCQNLAAPFCDLEQLIDYHRMYRALMKHFQHALPLQIHTVDYEEMVTNPERETRALIDHCGLGWSDACLEFHANKRAVHTPSKWQVRQPMYTSSVEKWRRFEKQLAPIAQRVEAELIAESMTD